MGFERGYVWFAKDYPGEDAYNQLMHSVLDDVFGQKTVKPSIQIDLGTRFIVGPSR